MKPMKKQILFACLIALLLLILSGALMELQIEAECREEDKDTVTQTLNRELILLFEEKGICLM